MSLSTGDVVSDGFTTSTPAPSNLVPVVAHERRVKLKSGIEYVLEVPARLRKRPVRRPPKNQPELEGFRFIEGQMSIYDVPGV